MDGERASRFDWGLAVSAGTHGALLLATLIAFADTRRFDEAQEALPVEVVTAAELNQIMRGEKTAQSAETSRTRAEQQAERLEQKPDTPTPQATRDVPVPPPPLRREPDPGEAAERAPPVPTPPPAPPRLAATPPPRPEPEKQAEAKPEPDKAEPVPRPPRRPDPPKAEAKPTPQARPRPPEPKPAEPKTAEAPPRPKDDRQRLDQVAKLLEEKKREERPAARPRAGEEEQPPSKYDPASIRKMLSRETPQQSAATGREVSRTASLGTATANAPRMSPSLWGQLDGLLQEQYRECWNKLGFDGQSYVPQIRVTYNADGSLAAEPVLVNPPGEPALRALADSAMRAVQKCNPLKIPPQFAPYHAQWRARTLRFDPEEM